MCDDEFETDFNEILNIAHQPSTDNQQLLTNAFQKKIISIKFQECSSIFSEAIFMKLIFVWNFLPKMHKLTQFWFIKN